MKEINKYLLILILACVLMRVFIRLTYEPIIYPDSGSYEKFTRQIQQGDLSLYDGTRTPVYPLLMLGAGLNYKLLWLIQSILGIAISAMLFRIALNHTRNNLLSLIIGLSYTLSLNQVYFEAIILTETLVTFLIVLSLLLVQKGHLQGNGVMYYALAGIISSIAGLTRPLFIFLAPLYLIALIPPEPLWRKIRYAVVFIIPFIVIIFGWCLFNKLKLDYFGPTTLTGYNLTQHSGAFMELAPDEYSQIRDIYLKFRQERIAESGTHSMTIWRAAPEIQKATGLSFSELSKQLAKMSLTMFIHHPVLYSQGVFKAWVRFWSSPNYWKRDKLHPQRLAGLMIAIWWAERVVLLAINFLFLVIVLYFLYQNLFRKHVSNSVLDLLIIAIVISASIIQALTEYGENGRYSIPIQPLVIYVVLVSLWCFFGKPVKEQAA
jgi:4-amino-4-deoxy-L-arabinose transferase-like glycosyltransferase